MYFQQELTLLFTTGFVYLSGIPAVLCKSVADTDSHQLVLEPSGIFAILLSAVVVLVLCIVLLMLCGGCTGMEVGTDTHPAAHGGSGSGGYNYNSVVTDANTRTMYASHTMPGEDNSYNPNSNQPLPYSLSPGGVDVAQGFTGYQSTGGYQGNVAEPPPPSYNESTRGNQFSGWSQ